LKKILLISSILFTFTTVGFANLIGLTPIQLEKKIKENNIKVIDIRTPMEWKETGIIKNSHKLMFFSMQGKVNIRKWLDDLSVILKKQNEPFVLVCRHGNRTQIVGEFLTKDLKFKNVYHLERGIVSWIKMNKKTVK
jgi:rhodanese-related sulfurtransferase